VDLQSVPVYARSRAVRDGITVALKLERCAEQEERLRFEAINRANEWVESLYTAWELRDIAAGTWLKHRLDLALHVIIASRPAEIVWNDCTRLWKLSARDLESILERNHPSILNGVSFELSNEDLLSIYADPSCELMGVPEKMAEYGSITRRVYQKDIAR